MFHPTTAKILSSLSTLALLLLTTTAHPTPDVPTFVTFPGQCPANVGIPSAFYICSETFFTGRCEWVNPQGTCFSWPGGAEGRSKSIGPDYGGICDVYDDEHCHGQVVATIVCPGRPDMSNTEGKRDWFGSMRCRVNFQLPPQ